MCCGSRFEDVLVSRGCERMCGCVSMEKEDVWI